MKMEAVFQKLEGLLADPTSRPMAVEMLKRLGIEPVSNDILTAQEKGKRAGIKKARERAKKIAEVCVKAGCANMAAPLISENISVEDATARVMAVAESLKGDTVQ